ncbi:MAG: glycoside hydrolase, family 38 [Cyanobacteria bacterium RYN_339]|nr:glycoside hydrolase, family 38 [Cyanobacteria bacterium RYN_339]
MAAMSHVPNATSAIAPRLQLVVVPHTHWDREWYLPFEQFRVQLVRLVDQLLSMFASDPAYSHFMLDGQTIVLEDYLAIRPENAAVLADLITAGKIAVGPWYVLPDEFLVSGEAIVRNLQVGMAIARRFGRSMELGYLPDSFGHLAQMPQVFRGFGFDSASLWRGVGDDNPGTEWLWEGPDGSQVYVQWLAGGYGNLANLPTSEREAFAKLQREVTKLQGLSRTRTFVLMNGSDHLMPQAFLPGHIEAFNALGDGWDVVQGSLADAIARARMQATDLPVIKGELRGAADTSLLPGVLSARTYLKQENVHAQTLLERWVEPFAAVAAVTARRPYPAALLRHAWKTLLQNHPHDSICGCSVDEVHREMLTRFAQVRQLGGVLRDESIGALLGEDPHADAARQAGLALYNPHPWRHLAPIEAVLTLACPADDDPVFSLVDEEGSPQAYEIVAIARGVRAVDDPPGQRSNVPTARVTVRLAASLPAFGHRTFQVKRSPMTRPRHPELRLGKDYAENRFFQVRVVGGGVEILDKALGETVLHAFEDRGDRGDEYNFCPVEGEVARLSRGMRWLTVNPVHAGTSLRLELRGEWRLPAELAPDRKSRQGDVPVAIALDVTLHAGVRRVAFDAQIDNQARDHRLRAAFTLPAAPTHTTADTAFGWVTRPTHVQERNWAEQPMGTHPMQSQVLVARPKGHVGLAARGLHEFEAVGDTLCLTLLRAVGWLSRDDLSTRKGDAGPMLETPEAQVQGPAHFHYAWSSQDGEEPEGTLWRRGAEFVAPALAVPLATWAGHKADSWLSVDEPAWQFSALKRSETGTALVLRVFNGSAEAKPGTLKLGFPVRAVHRARLDETPGEELVYDEDGLALTLAPAEIATFLIEPT